MSATVATRILTPVLVLAALVGGLAVGARWHERVSTWFGHDHATSAPEAPSDGAPAQLWTCGMHPQIIKKEPANCPICGMALTPIRANAAGASAGERKIKHYQSTMNPGEVSPRPGKDSMGMEKHDAMGKDRMGK